MNFVQPEIYANIKWKDGSAKATVLVNFSPFIGKSWLVETTIRFWYLLSFPFPTIGLNVEQFLFDLNQNIWCSEKDGITGNSFLYLCCTSFKDLFRLCCRLKWPNSCLLVWSNFLLPSKNKTKLRFKGFEELIGCCKVVVVVTKGSIYQNCYLQENANYAVIEFIWKLFCFKNILFDLYNLTLSLTTNIQKRLRQKNAYNVIDDYILSLQIINHCERQLFY